MPDWFLRRAEATDAPALARCIDAAYSIYAGRGLDLPAVPDGVAGDIDSNVVWVAKQDRKIVGGLVMTVRSDHVRLANVAVDPKCMGKGLGRGLLEQAEAVGRELGKPEMRLTTHVGLPENIHYYSRLGWIESGRSGDRVFMIRML